MEFIYPFIIILFCEFIMKTEKNLREDIGYYIRKSRQEKSLTASQLGDLVKLSQQQVSRYECGITRINIDMLNVFLIALDKNWSDFFFSVMADYSNEIKELKTGCY